MFKRAAVIIAGIVLVFAALESALRVRMLFDANRGLRNSMGDISRKYCHVFKPGSRFRLVASKNDEYDVAVSINNYGFRGRDMTVAKPKGTIRILAVGDSFTFGVGAEDARTIPALLEERLNEEAWRVEVINAGFGNYSPILHYLKIRDEYLEFNPDIVMLFYDFSDLADDWRGERHLVYDSSGAIKGCDLTYVNGRRDWWAWARMHSRLLSYIHNKFFRTIDKIRILGLKGYIEAKVKGKRAKSLIVTKDTPELETIKYDGYLMIRGRGKLPEIKKYFAVSEKYLDLIKETLDKRGIQMILVIYPYGIHVGPDQWGTGRTFWGFEKGKVYGDYYAFDLLEDYAKRSRVPCINLLPAFLKEKDRRLFFDWDGHFTPEANEIAAGEIAASPILTRALETAAKREN